MVVSSVAMHAGEKDAQSDWDFRTNASGENDIASRRPCQNLAQRRAVLLKDSSHMSEGMVVHLKHVLVSHL